MRGMELINIIKKIVISVIDSMKPTEFMVGEVTSISPLKIKVDGRFEIDETFLILSQFVQETWIKIPEDSDYKHLHIIPAVDSEGGVWQTDPAAGPATHTHTISQWKTELALEKIKLWRGLKEGDKVYLLRIRNGNQFFVMQRAEGVINDA